MRIFLIFTFSILIFSSKAQTLELVDEISGDVGEIKDILINSSGSRFYLLEDVSDSIDINGQLTYLLPRDTILGSPHYFGRSYFAGVNNSSYFIRRPGGTTMTLMDSTVLVFTAFIEDTLTTQDSLFINASLGNSGSNLLLIQYDYAGNVLKAKQWPTVCHCHLQVNEAIRLNDNIYICGEYSSLETINLDHDFLNRGYSNSFLGNMTLDFDFQNLSTISGTLEEYSNQMAISATKKVLITGASSSTQIHFCQDSLENNGEFNFGTSFIYFVQFDTSGNCINKKTIDYDFGGTLPNSITSLSDNSYVVAGNYDPTFISFDSLYLFNPNHEQRGFLVRLAEDLQAKAVFHLEGSEGSKYILSMERDANENIWICGIVQTDTIKFGEFIFSAEEGEEYFGFLAKLDYDFNPMFAIKLDGIGKKLVLGEDGFMYILEDLWRKGDQIKLYKINDITHNTDHSSDDDYDIEINVFPNPVMNHHEINYEIKDLASIRINQINVYDTVGSILYSTKVDENKGSIELNCLTGIVLLEFRTIDNNRIIKKVLLY